MKNLSFIVLISLILILFSPSVWATPANDVIVKIDGRQVEFPDAKPFIQTETNRTMIPIRFVAESMGAEVQWVANSRTVIIKKSDKTITLVIGYKKAVVNGIEVTFDAAATIVQDRTFVPLRFVMETLDASVEWVSATRTVEIKTDVYKKGGFIIPKDCSIKVLVGSGDDKSVSLDLDIESEISLKKQYSDLKIVLSSRFSENLVNQIIEYVKLKEHRDYDLQFKSFKTEDGKYIIGVASGAGNPTIAIPIITQ